MSFVTSLWGLSENRYALKGVHCTKGNAIMILKERTQPTPTDRFGAAGDKAERQVAHYLARSFGDTRDVLILNDLRVMHDGEVAQIDHLLLHRSGMVIIESKSVSSELFVNRQSEFTRSYQGKRSGMPSPIQQAKRQAALLRKLIDTNKSTLLPKTFGLLQQGFGNFPIEIVVAISDRGIIKHQGKRPPELLKADALTDRLQELVSHHKKGRGFAGLIRQTLSENKKEFEGAGLYNLKQAQLELMAQFLLSCHVEPAPRTAGS